MQHARTTVAALDPMLFNLQLHGAKAEGNTFLAWQEKPPASMRGAVEKQIFDINAPEGAKLVAWLQRIFV